MPRSVFTDAYAELREVLVEARQRAGLTQVELRTLRQATTVHIES